MSISRSIFAVALAALALSACGKSTTQKCPTSFDGLKGVTTCSCTGDSSQSGAVWGTDIYTSDSSICSAAKHAGVITSSGDVSVAKGDDCKSYVGSAKNGVTTADWPSHPGGSFYFTAHAKPSCPTK